MIIHESALNKKYLSYCTATDSDPLNEESTKAFMGAFMARQRLTHVKKQGEYFHFIKLLPHGKQTQRNRLRKAKRNSPRILR